MKLHKQSGVAVVELALVIIPMLILCFGITELGRALYQYDGVVKAARNAARYLTQQNLNDPDIYSAAQAVAKSMVVCGNSACAASDTRLVPGLETEDQVSIATHRGIGTGAGTVDLVTVTVGDRGSKAVRFSSMLPIPGWWLDNFSFAPVAITMAYSTT
jgi:Flp pilus assembly protein TadG